MPGKGNRNQPNRQPAGVPTGGQFAPDARGRAEVYLDGARKPQSKTLAQTMSEHGFSPSSHGIYEHTSGLEVSVDTGSGCVEVFKENMIDGWEPGALEAPLVAVDYDRGVQDDQQRALDEALGIVAARQTPLTDVERDELAKWESELDERGTRGAEIADRVDDLRRRARLGPETPTTAAENPSMRTVNGIIDAIETAVPGTATLVLGFGEEDALEAEHQRREAEYERAAGGPDELRYASDPRQASFDDNGYNGDPDSI